MKVLFDSSVLIASFVLNHPKHTSAFAWLKRAKEKEFSFYVSAHSLLEVYSVLTSAPFVPKILSTAARKLIDENVKKIAKIISLNGAEYFEIIEEVTQLGLQGGIVYDALIAKCARKAKVEKLVTLNSKDFALFKGLYRSVEIVGL